MITVFASVQFSFAGEEIGNTEWRGRMQGMLKEVLVLFPYAFDDGKLNDTKNSAQIEKSIRTLSGYSSGLKKHTTRMKMEEGLKIDPSFPFIAEAFEQELNSAQASFKKTGRSNKETQIYLRSALSKCMLCHSQTANGPELKLNQFKKAFSALATKDRFLAYAATRQFDEALDVFEKLLEESKVKAQDQSNLDQSIKAALAIVVRVKKDPKKTTNLIEKIAQSEAGSSLLQNDLKDWRASAQSWQAEKSPVLNSDQLLFNEANRLIDSRKKRAKSIEAFENSDISLLRASSFLHEILSSYPKSTYRAQSYLMLASTYEMLPGFAIWDLADEYLGACIQENPHSQIGEKCFEQYNSNITVGYSGSAGTNIPAAVREHLSRLKELSKQKLK